MVLLTAIRDHRPDRTACTVEIPEYAAFRGPDGLVLSWVGIEYMAQCIAAHRGLRSRANGEPIKVGFLVGSKRVAFRTVEGTLTVVLPDDLEPFRSGGRP
jgi:predicted hotdog family 3-hydroxylacyl-ACP dehydratase